MKTTLHRHAPVPLRALDPGEPPAGDDPPPRRAAHPSTARLGIALSAVAALATVVIEAVADVPVAVILLPVVVIGFALSWHTSGRGGRRSGRDERRAV